MELGGGLSPSPSHLVAAAIPAGYLSVAAGLPIDTSPLPCHESGGVGWDGSEAVVTNRDYRAQAGPGWTGRALLFLPVIAGAGVAYRRR